MSYMLKRPALKDLVLFCAKIEQGLVWMMVMIFIENAVNFFFFFFLGGGRNKMFATTNN